MKAEREPSSGFNGIGMELVENDLEGPAAVATGALAIEAGLARAGITRVEVIQVGVI